MIRKKLQELINAKRSDFLDSSIPSMVNEIERLVKESSEISAGDKHGVLEKIRLLHNVDPEKAIKLWRLPDENETLPIGNMAMTPDGGIIVSDIYNHKLLALSFAGDQLSRDNAAGGFWYPEGLCLLEGGGALVADYWNHRIVKVSENLEIQKSFGKVGDDYGSLFEPVDVASFNGEIYVLERGGNRIQVFDEEGNLLRALGSRGKRESERRFLHPLRSRWAQGPLDGKLIWPRIPFLEFPQSMCALEEAGVLIADTNNHRVVRLTFNDFNEAGERIITHDVDFILSQDWTSYLRYPVCVRRKGDLIAVTQFNKPEVAFYDTSGLPICVYDLSSVDSSLRPNKIAFGEDDRIFISDFFSPVIIEAVAPDPAVMNAFTSAESILSGDPRYMAGLSERLRSSRETASQILIYKLVQQAIDRQGRMGEGNSSEKNEDAMEAALENSKSAVLALNDAYDGYVQALKEKVSEQIDIWLSGQGDIHAGAGGQKRWPWEAAKKLKESESRLEEVFQDSLAAHCSISDLAGYLLGNAIGQESAHTVWEAFEASFLKMAGFFVRIADGRNALARSIINRLSTAAKTSKADDIIGLIKDYGVFQLLAQDFRNRRTESLQEIMAGFAEVFDKAFASPDSRQEASRIINAEKILDVISILYSACGVSAYSGGEPVAITLTQVVERLAATIDEAGELGSSAKTERLLIEVGSPAGPLKEDLVLLAGKGAKNPLSAKASFDGDAWARIRKFYAGEISKWMDELKKYHFQLQKLRYQQSQIKRRPTPDIKNLALNNRLFEVGHISLTRYMEDILPDFAVRISAFSAIPGDQPGYAEALDSTLSDLRSVMETVNGAIESLRRKSESSEAEEDLPPDYCKKALKSLLAAYSALPHFLSYCVERLEKAESRLKGGVAGG